MNNYNKVVESEVIGVHQEGITVQKIKIHMFEWLLG
jgi:hypothetical protein